MFEKSYYHGIIRKCVVAFGNLFTDLTIIRKDRDGVKSQLIKVPIAYGPKEKWLRHVQENPDLSKKIKMDLPRMSFEVVDYAYDSSRKIGPNQNYLKDPENRKISTPIPYNISFRLYVVSRTQEDSLNMMEQILPMFAPAVNVNIRIMDDPVSWMDMPIVLNDVQIADNWDQDWEEGRIVVNTLEFTMKTYLFGPVLDGKIIKRSIANVGINHDVPPTGDLDPTYTAELNPFATTESRDDDYIIDEFWVNN
jgi:hypothetical protein